jgi:hypothetical protein
VLDEPVPPKKIGLKVWKCGEVFTTSPHHFSTLAWKFENVEKCSPHLHTHISTLAWKFENVVSGSPHFSPLLHIGLKVWKCGEVVTTSPLTTPTSPHWLESLKSGDRLSTLAWKFENVVRDQLDVSIKLKHGDSQHNCFRDWDIPQA